jgi:hypothetical protein
MNTTLKIVGARFLRGLAAGAVSAMIIIVPSSTTSWLDLRAWLMALVIAGLFGGITGGLLAIEKYLRLPEELK